MSSNVRQVRAEVEQLRGELHTLKVETAAYNSLLSNTLTLMGAAGLSSAADIRRMISLLYSLKAAYDMVQLARMAAGDPLAWAGAILQVSVTTYNAYETARSYG